MARADIVNKVKNTIYGSGLYERPPLIQLGSNATVSPSSNLVTLNTGDAAKVKPGSVLSTTSGDAAADWCFYVTTTAGGSVTGTATYHGSTAPSGSDLTDLIMEHNPKSPETEIHQAIDRIVNAYLWPDLWKWTEATIATPNLATMQDEVPADVEAILSAHQRVGTTWKHVKYALQKHLHTTISSTGNLASFGYLDGGTLYYTYQAKLAEADTSDTEYPWLEDLIAIGAAALVIDQSVAYYAQPYRPNTQDVQPTVSAAEALWRQFLTMRETSRLDLSRDNQRFEVIH